MSQKDADKIPWAEMARSLVKGYIWHVAPKYSPFVDANMPDGSVKRFDSIEDWVFFDEGGAQICTVSQLQAVIAKSTELGSVLLDNAPDGGGDFWVQWVPPVDWFVMTPGGKACRAARIGFGIRTDTERAEARTKSALSEGKVVTLMAAAMRSGDMEVVVQEGEDHSPRVKAALRLKPTPEREA